MVSFRDLGRSPADVLAAIPATEAGEPDRGYPADLRWLLERLAAGEAIRINCGGEEYRSAEGLVFGRDRFSMGGKPSTPYGGDVAGTTDSVLYRSERWFPAWEEPLALYRFPLPRGRYRVTLHFAEVFLPNNFPGQRVFDVLIEGATVLKDFEPTAGGMPTAKVEAFEVLLADGLLEIQFVPRVDNPKVSAIEVELVEGRG